MELLLVQPKLLVPVTRKTVLNVGLTTMEGEYPFPPDQEYVLAPTAESVAELPEQIVKLPNMAIVGEGKKAT